MTRTPSVPPVRIIDAGPPGDDISAAVADGIARTIDEKAAFSTVDRARIRARLAAATTARRRPRWRPIVAAIVIFLLGSTVGAAVLERLVIPRIRRQSPVGAAEPGHPPRAARPPRSSAVIAGSEPSSVEPGGPSPDAPAASAAAAPRPRRTAEKRAAEAAATAPPERPAEPDGEAAALASILRLLRHAHDAQAALAALDAYDRRYPNGLLMAEAARARVDALMALGRAREALAVLDRMSFHGALRSTELQTLRGELRAKHGRCSDAVEDFSAVLATGRPDLDERALFGRAGCRARLGDEAGARVDLDAYQALFPNGRFMEQIRRRGAGGE